MVKIVEEYKKHQWIRIVCSLVMVLASSFLQTYSIQTFMRPSELLSSGFTGVSILLNYISEMFGFNFDISLGIIILNVPVALLCMRSISKKFTILSSIQFLTTSFLLKFVSFDPIFDDVMLNCLIGGTVYGFATLLALKGNASTGGTDFIALYVSNKINKSIWSYVFLFNCSMLCIFGALKGWEYAGYSILFQFISTKTIETFHHRYDRLTLQVTTIMPEEVIKAYVAEYRHGITVCPGYGGYSHKEFYLLQTVVSSYEVKDIVNIVRSVDDHAIINVLKTENFYGGFKPKPID